MVVVVVLLLVVVVVVVGVSLADFRRGSAHSTQSFLHRYTSPTTTTTSSSSSSSSSLLDFHTEEYRMCEITAFMKY